jgi:hypothetical protein
MVAENAVMPSAASRSERIIFSFVQLLAGRLLKEDGSGSIKELAKLFKDFP